MEDKDTNNAMTRTREAIQCKSSGREQVARRRARADLHRRCGGGGGGAEWPARDGDAERHEHEGLLHPPDANVLRRHRGGTWSNDAWRTCRPDGPDAPQARRRLPLVALAAAGVGGECLVPYMNSCGRSRRASLAPRAGRSSCRCVFTLVRAGGQGGGRQGGSPLSGGISRLRRHGFTVRGKLGCGA